MKLSYNTSLSIASNFSVVRQNQGNYTLPRQIHAPMGLCGSNPYVYVCVCININLYYNIYK